MIWGITLILLSIIAVPSLLLSKKPNAKELLQKVEPYQGWIGLVFFFWGVWGVISAVLSIGLLAKFPIWWITLLVGNVIEVVLGFMLGFSLINKYVLSKTPAGEEKGNIIRKWLAPNLGRLGVLGLIIGVWMIVASFLFL